MIHERNGVPVRRVLPAIVLGLLAVAGCGDGVGKRYPVSGKVLVEGRPLVGKTGAVVFKPDRLKGNPNTVEAVGTIDAEGNYALSTLGKPGARQGWYKVIVTVAEPGQSRIENRTTTGRKSKTTLVIPARYADDEKSGLLKEVVAEATPERYDLNLGR
jgi:hypothetical protein